jgi:hypothetical protein
MEITLLGNTESLLVLVIVADDLRPTDVISLPRDRPLNPFRQHLNPCFKQIVRHRATLDGEVPFEHRRIPAKTLQMLIDLPGADAHTLFGGAPDNPVVEDQAAQSRGLERVVVRATPSSEPAGDAFRRVTQSVKSGGTGITGLGSSLRAAMNSACSKLAFVITVPPTRATTAFGSLHEPQRSPQPDQSGPPCCWSHRHHNQPQPARTYPDSRADTATDETSSRQHIMNHEDHNDHSTHSRTPTPTHATHSQHEHHLGRELRSE